MSQAPTTVTASSTQTPPAATTTLPRITTAPRGIAESASTISSAAESPSCLSQIGSMISSIVSSIFSFISSLWNCVTGGTSQTIAPAQPPAEVLSARADSFFNEITSLDIRQDTPHKVALLIDVDGQKVALLTRDLPPLSSNTNPFREFCIEGMDVLRRILRQNPSLSPQSTVQLYVADIRRHSGPEARSITEHAGYRLLSTTLIAADNISSFNLGDGQASSLPLVTAAQICAGHMFGHSTSNQNPLRIAFMHFMANHVDARNGWLHAD